MVKYQKYQSVQIKWMDEMPIEWRTTTLRNVFDEIRDTNSNGEALNALSLMKDIGIIPYEEKGNVGNKKSDKIEKYKKVKKEDFVINKMNAVLGSLGISRYEGLVSPVYFVLRNQNLTKTNPYYYEYIFQTRIVQKYLRTLAKGIMEIREAIDWVEFKNMGLPLPPISVQNRTVNYLKLFDTKIKRFIQQKLKYVEFLKDYKRSVINELVTKGLNKKIKLKDSGIDWLGQIPEQYQIRKLKEVTNLIIDGTHFTPTYVKEGIPFLRVTDISQSKNLNVDDIKKITKEEHVTLTKRCKPEKGDLLVSKNGTIGIPRVIDWDFDFSIFVSLCLIKVKNIININFLAYLFLSELIKEQIKDFSKSNTVTNLHLNKIREITILIPPLSEQIEIVEKIKKEEERIENMISKAQEQINVIEEYRQSVIYEVVTGGKKVN